MEQSEKTLDMIVNLCKNRGYVFPGSEIYGGLANSWDYGPLGVEFKNNVKKAWLKKFVQESPYNVGLDAAIIMNPQTWVTTGHVSSFSDPLLDCRACKARHRADKLIGEEHPEVKLNIHIIDSQTYSMAYGMAVVEAARMAKDGASVEEITAHIQDWIENTRPMFVPLNLKCVKKSGRISPAAAFVGDAIGLKPLITFEDGEAKILSKVRGESKAIAALVDICKKERRPGTSYCLVYGNNLPAFEALKKACADFDQPPMAEYNVGCIISINTGPDMIGILYRR